MSLSPPQQSSSSLIPGLPDDTATAILSLLSPSAAARARSTCRSWRSLLSFPRPLLHLRSLLGFPRQSLFCFFPSDPTISSPLLFDPFTLAWASLPPLPISLRTYSLSNFIPVFKSPHLYLIGGSRFDAGAYPLDHPRPCSAVYRIDLSVFPIPSQSAAWRRVPNMIAARGGFACAPDSSGRILVAGGGSRHHMLPSSGTRTATAEVFDHDKWLPLPNMPKHRAGCVGFVVHSRGAKEEEFWVMGGYGDYTALGGIVPADVYCRDAVVLGLSSGKWREIGSMWEEEERVRLGPVAVVEKGDGDASGVFMLDGDVIFRYCFTSNRWLKESILKRKILSNDSCCFAALSGELYVLSASPSSIDARDFRKTMKKQPVVDFQIYDPKMKKWRFLMTNPPLQQPINFKVAALCGIEL